MKCFHWQKMGQVKRECRLWEREQTKEKGDAQENNKENTTAIIDGNLDIIYDKSLVNLTCQTSDWVINSSDLFHVTAYRDYFTSYANGDYGHVRMRNEGTSKIVGRGDICLERIDQASLEPPIPPVELKLRKSTGE